MVKLVVAVASSRQMLEATGRRPTVRGRRRVKTLESSPDGDVMGEVAEIICAQQLNNRSGVWAAHRR